MSHYIDITKDLFVALFFAYTYQRDGQYYPINDENIHFETSHFIHAPNKAGAYTTSRTSESTEEIALERAISTITEPYDSAISEGYIPSADWLVKNDFFDQKYILGLN